MGCRDYRDVLRDKLTAESADPALNPELAAHLGGCSACRDAVETAALASQLVREAQRPTRTSEAFVTRVMAAIREQQGLVTGPAAIWRPLEFLASRAALIASVLLLGLTFYLAEFAPERSANVVSGQTEIGAGLPERPAYPANDDDVLITLAEMGNAF